MTARQKLILMIGLGLVGVALIISWRSKAALSQSYLTSSDTWSESNDTSSQGNSVSTIARRIWDTIPATPYLPLLSSTESALGIPDTLLTRMAWIESRFNPVAKSPKGAVGIMQIVPSMHPGVNAQSPQAAIPYAGNYLRSLYSRFGSWEKAVAAYNWGEGNLQKAIAARGDNWKSGLPAETANYLAQVNQVIDLPA
jgi:soluble lytic murein transglycosylase-like protein